MTSQLHRWRWLPQPLLSLLLWLVWLMLNHSVAFGHLLLGAVIAWIIPFMIQPMMDPQPALLRPWTALRYFLRLMMDIVVSNLLVAKQVMDR
jgi:multicomponent K+:H+ antiporter subunit E